MPYVVTELLKATRCATVSKAALPLRRMTEYGTQIARGLAAGRTRAASSTAT